MSPLIQHYSFPRAPLISSFSSVYLFFSPLLPFAPFNCDRYASNPQTLLRWLIHSLTHLIMLSIYTSRTPSDNSFIFQLLICVCQFQCIRLASPWSSSLRSKWLHLCVFLDRAWSISTYIKQFNVCPLCYHCKNTHAWSILATLFITVFFSPHIFFKIILIKTWSWNICVFHRLILLNINIFFNQNLNLDLTYFSN